MGTLVPENQVIYRTPIGDCVDVTWATLRQKGANAFNPKYNRRGSNSRYIEQKSTPQSENENINPPVAPEFVTMF